MESVMMAHPVIPKLGRWRQEDHEFKVSLSYTERPCLKKPRTSDIAQ
jgi:hypothetical protein